MSELVKYAESELKRAGLFDKDSDYDGMLGKAALDIIKLFSKQGHSGFSASMTTQIVERLMRFEPLTPLTYEPDEWNDVSDISGYPMWQNKRKSSVFSKDCGKTHYDIDEPKLSAFGRLRAKLRTLHFPRTSSNPQQPSNKEQQSITNKTGSGE